MVNGLSKFEIQLDNRTAIYKPGDTVSGRLILEIYKSKRFKALKLRLNGECGVRWMEKSLHRDTTDNFNKTTHSGAEIYIQSEIILLQQLTGDNVELSCGYYIYPFNLVLPRNIPSSFEHMYGNVRYTLKAIFDRPWKFDHETTKSITVATPFELTEVPHSMAGVEHSVDKNFYCCILPCIRQGSLSVRWRLAKTGFTIGETLELVVSMDNQSKSVEVQSLTLQLQQIIFFSATRPASRKQVNQVVKINKIRGHFSPKDEVVINLQIPSVPVSRLSFCNLINIQYVLEFSVKVSGCHFGVNKKYDIFIGSPPEVLPNFIPHTPLPPTAPTAATLMNAYPPYPIMHPVPLNTENNEAAKMPLPSQILPYPPQPEVGLGGYGTFEGYPPNLSAPSTVRRKAPPPPDTTK